MPILRSFRDSLRDVVGENRTWILSWIIIVIVVILVIRLWPQGPSPVPKAIKIQANFAIIYPRGYSIDTASWKYLSAEQSIQFTAQKDNYKIVFTEEKTPLEYQDDVAAYNRFIGSLRPRANFNVSLGGVAISNFVTAGDYQVVGETGILNAKGTLVLAHPDTQISDAQWRSLFEALTVE